MLQAIIIVILFLYSGWYGNRLQFTTKLDLLESQSALSGSITLTYKLQNVESANKGRRMSCYKDSKNNFVKKRFDYSYKCYKTKKIWWTWWKGRKCDVCVWAFLNTLIYQVGLRHLEAKLHSHNSKMGFETWIHCRKEKSRPQDQLSWPLKGYNRICLLKLSR